MNKEKSLFLEIAEVIDHRISQHKSSTDYPNHQPGYPRRFLHWLIPNGGTILLMVALIATAQVWARPLTNTTAAPGPSATTVNYQGRLANSDGTPLTEDGVAMGFAIYDAEEGGNLIWPPSGSEDHAVNVSDGLFSVPLGSETGGGIPTTTWNGDRYLEITVGGETLEPRELIRSVPIAGMALTVPDGSISATQLGSDVRLLRIDSGEMFQNHSASEWTLHEGDGNREHIVPVVFETPFSNIPVVRVSLGTIDAHTDVGTRIRVEPRNITAEGFDLVYRTWWDSKVNGATAVWIAYGE